MGRTLKRVSLDFNWPIDKVWGGYLNPFYAQSTKCLICDETGYSPDAKRFQDEWYGIVPFDAEAYGATPLTIDHPALQAFARRQCERTPEYYGSNKTSVQHNAERLFKLFIGQWCHHLIQADVDALIAEGRLMEFTHVPRTEEQAEIVRAKVAAGGNSWLPESNGYMPTADEVNAWSIGGPGHDSINAWVCIDARCKREGVERTCRVCSGEGRIWPTPEIKQQAETWCETEPPAGDGFQLWETTSEGSPISPVFATIEELCAWCAENATTFGSNKTSADVWRRMLDENLVTHREGNIVFV